MPAHVYILASKVYGTLYIGVTTNLPERIGQHKSKAVAGFTEQHNVTRLIYFEEFFDVRDAITREKQLKKWRRAWKIELIEQSNPDWEELLPY
jgi:putative endonuclease